MQIAEINVFTVHGPYQGPEYPAGDRQAQALDIYPEFNERPANRAPQAGSPQAAMYVEVVTEEGVRGLWGPIQDFQAFLIVRKLRPLLLGRDALATEYLFDLMVRSDRHGRSGMYMTAVSSLDCALWDLKGKILDQPVYRLLGGPTRPQVPAYASMLGFSVEPDAAAEVAQAYKEMGFRAQKWFFRYGPGDGDAGVVRNLAMAHAVREAVGHDYTLMFDAFMGWDLTFARAMVQGLETVRPFWMEEPLPPERVGEFVALRNASRVPLATGEHVYTRWQTKQLLVAGAVDFLQNDPDWTGGVTELAKIVTLASSFETPVIAHGHSLLPALHVAGSQSPTAVPFVEYLIRNQPVKQNFHRMQYTPEQGSVTLPEQPGLGLELDDAKIERREPFVV